MNARLASLALVALMVVPMLALLPAARAQDPTGSYGGTLRVGVLSLPVTDPTNAAAWRDGNTVVLDILYDSFARVDPETGMLIPWAANSWTYDSATGDMTVSLRDDLRFADNSPLDAADVVASFQHYSMFSSLVSQVDPLTVAFDFSAGNAGRFFTDALTAKLAWDQTGTMRASGPYDLGTSTGTSLALNANPHYWNGRPHLDTIVYTAYLDMFALSCAMLLDSTAMDLVGVHLVPNDLYNLHACGFPPNTAQNRSLINANQSMTVDWTLLQKNPGTKQLTIGFDYANPMFQGAAGKDLRRAISMMLNKELYNQIEPNSIPTHGLTPSTNTAWVDTAWVYYINPGFTGSGTAKRTAYDAAFKALVDAGYMDADGDGWREDLLGSDFQLTVATPSFTLDPRKTTVGLDVQDTLKRSGINAQAIEYATWASLAAATDDIRIWTYDPLTTVPSFLYSNADLAAANDADVDFHLDLAADCTDIGCLRTHVNHVLYYATQNAVVLPMVNYDSLEVVNTWNFGGWVPSLGGVNNFWSMVGVSVPSLGALDVSVLPIDARANEGETVTVPVLVTDSSGVSVTGATVELWPAGAPSAILALDNGNATMGDQTPDDGIYTAKVTTPSVAVDTDWTITAVAYKPRYQSDSAETTIAVHAATPQLLVRTSWDQRELAGSEDTATLTVTVLDVLNNPVARATVGATVGIPGGMVDPASATTDALGKATFTVSASVTQRTHITVGIVVAAAGYQPAGATPALVADPDPVPFTPAEKTVNVPGLEAVALVALVGILGALLRVRRKPGK